MNDQIKLRKEYVKDIKALSQLLGKHLKTEIELLKVWKNNGGDALLEQIKIARNMQKRTEHQLNTAIQNYSSTFGYEEANKRAYE